MHLVTNFSINISNISYPLKNKYKKLLVYLKKLNLWILKKKKIDKRFIILYFFLESCCGQKESILICPLSVYYTINITN